jgi:AI-2 transport protein TqsA
MSELDPETAPRGTVCHVSKSSGARVLLIAAGLVVVGFGISEARDVLAPLLFGALFAAATQPAVKYLEERLHFPPGLAVLASMVGVMAVLALASGTLFLGFLDVASDLPRYEVASVHAQQEAARSLMRAGLPHFAALVQTRGAVDVLTAGAAAFVDEIPHIFAFATLSALVTIFGLLERGALLRKLPNFERLTTSCALIASDTQKYLGVKSAVSALTGLSAGLLCWGLGLPNAPLWGAITFWFHFIPVVGGLISAVPPIFIALIFGSPWIALAVAFGYLLINCFFGNYVEPQWQGRSAGLSPLAIIVSIAVWGGLLGPVGAFLSVPLTMVVKIGCNRTSEFSWFARLLEFDLQGRLSVLPATRRGGGAPPESPSSLSPVSP